MNEKNKTSKLSTIDSALCNMAGLSKKMLKYATPVTLFLTVLGTIFFVVNRTGNNYSNVFEVTATSLITNSFFLLAEFIIASLVIDILNKKRAGK